MNFFLLLNASIIYMESTSGKSEKQEKVFAKQSGSWQHEAAGTATLKKEEQVCLAQ